MRVEMVRAADVAAVYLEHLKHYPGIIGFRVSRDRKRAKAISPLLCN